MKTGQNQPEEGGVNFALQLTVLMKEFRAKIQGRNLEAITETETLEEFCSLSCQSFAIAASAFTYSPAPLPYI